MSESSLDDTTYEPCEGCAELLDVTTFGPFQSAICPLCSVKTRVKRTFGSYRLQQRYAIGGMSVIFIGHDTTLDRKVAIKVLNEEYCNDEIRIQAFENEARLTPQISHPNVVKVYTVGRAYGRLYLIMELIEGRSFQRIIEKRGALPEDEVLEIAIHIATGLQAAKEAGMIHRNVKPANILIDREGRARLIDFGLALITKDGSAQTEEAWATPFYISPEALERGTVNFRSDIYAFGATLYHALAGRPPFDTTSTSNKVLRRAKQTIPPLCQVAQWITPSTGETIDRMMAFKPEHRWKSYQDVIQALKHARRNIGQNTPTPDPTDSRRKRRRNSGALSFALITGLLTTAALLAFWQPWKNINTTASAPLTPALTTPPATLFTPTQSSDPELTKAWRSSHLLTTQGKFSLASQSLDSLSQNTSLSKASRGWASLEASANAFLNGEPNEARRLATQTIAHLKGANNSDPNIPQLRHHAQILSRIPPPPKSKLPQKPHTLTDALGSFTIALKLWEQSQWETALPIFAQVRSLTLPPEFDWFQSYQKIADTYLADGQILSTLKDLPTPKKPAEASSQINLLADALKSLQTKGRATYNLRARQAYLSRLRKSFQKKTLVSHSSNWHQALPTLTNHGKKYQFSKIATILADPPSDTPPDALWAWQFLNKEATAFLTHLANQTDWIAEKRDGTEITPKSTSPDGLTLPDNSPLPWPQLKPESLIAAHTGSEIQAIAAAYLLGLTTLAEEKAEALAATDPEFLRNWKRVLIGTSQ